MVAIILYERVYIVLQSIYGVLRLRAPTHTSPSTFHRTECEVAIVILQRSAPSSVPSGCEGSLYKDVH